MVALAPLLGLAALLLALGFMLAGQAFINSIFGLVGKLAKWTVVGNLIAGQSLHAIQKRFNEAMVGVIAGLEGQISDTWHVLAELTIRVGGAIFDVAETAARLQWYVTVKYPLSAIDRLAHAAYHAGKGAVIHTTTIVRTVKVQGQAIAHAGTGQIAAGARAALKPLTAELDWLERWTIPRVRGLERDLHGLRARIHAPSLRWGTLAFAAAVAAVLAKLGLGWARCGKVGKVGRRVCGLNDDLLDVLLAGTLIIGGSLSIVTFAEACVDAQDEVMPLVKAGVRELKGL